MFWTDQCKDGKWLVDKVANHDLSNGKPVFLLKAAYPLKAVAIFFVIKENSDASVRRDFVQRILFETSKIPACRS